MMIRMINRQNPNKIIQTMNESVGADDKKKFIFEGHTM